MNAHPPVLWHLKISHYNEKARWALDYKGVDHIRRAVTPGLQEFRARRVAGSRTTPVLELDGRGIGDSTAIIEAIEQRWPDPALYPADPDERARALELEDFFDEQCGPDLRRVLFDELMAYPDLFVTLMYGEDVRGRGLLRAIGPVARRLVRWRYAINPERVAQSRAKVIAAVDRVGEEVGPSGYLVGDSFSVADLTAASILAPLVQPPEFPYRPLPPERWPEPALRFRDELSERPGFEWVLDTYRRHRGASAEVPAPA